LDIDKNCKLKEKRMSEAKGMDNMGKLLKKLIIFMMAGTFTLSAAFPAMNLQAEGDSSTTNGESTVTQFMDCIEPMPIIEGLSSDCWGAAEVGPRDQANGLEDRNMTSYSYWDGGIIKDDDTGKYYMFASRWNQAGGHWGQDGISGWQGSQAIYAVSDNLYGPYEDKGPIWPDWCEGAGHNVFPFELSESDPLYDNGYRYAISISDTGMHGATANGTIHIARSPQGPWDLIDNSNGGKLKAAGGSGFSLSNISIMVRPDGKYEATNRNGDIAIADSLSGTWEVKENGLWKKVTGMPSDNIEDPVIWYSDGLYHIVANKWDARMAYYLTSEDGITNWKRHPGTAYTPDADFLRYENGTVNNWAKIERPNIYVEDGKIKAMIFAVIDVQKEADYGNDQHGSKVIVVPFSSEKLTEFGTQPDPLENRGGLLPIADTNTQTWGDEVSKNYGAEHYIQLQKDTNYQNQGKGILGEGTRPDEWYDCKIGYLKYDISSYNLSDTNEIKNVYLSLVYLNKSSGDADTEQIQVTLADSNWEEGIGRESVNSNQADSGTLTWENQPSLNYDVSDIENTTATSDEFRTADVEKEVKIDVTKLVKQFMEEHPGETVLSFAMNVTVTGTRIRIGSKEAGDSYAPKIIINKTVAPNITTTTLVNGTVGKAYSQTLTAEGDSPITWNITSGKLPDGLNLSETGIISGTPTTAGTFTFTSEATNSIGRSTKVLKITVAPQNITKTCATPTANKPLKTYTGSVNVTLKSTTKEAKIYYTTNGDNPTTKSKYIANGKKIKISKTTTLKFMAAATGYQNSKVTTVKYTIKTTKPGKKAVPVSKKVKRGGGIMLKAPKEVTLYYTVNGKNPTPKTKTKVNSGKEKQITITKKTTIRVIAVKKGCEKSAVVKRTYKVK